jgi:alpha-D-xyloside xylohydrolase
MKFRRGAWLWENGFSAHSMQRVCSYRLSPDSLRVHAVDVAGTKGVDAFEGRVLQIDVSSPIEGVIRVRTIHHRPGPGSGFGFDVDPSLRAEKASTSDTNGVLKLTSGPLSLSIPRENAWSMHFDAGDTSVTHGGNGCLSIVHSTQPESTGATKWLCQRLSLSVGEHIYGFGERFGAFVKNGQSVITWNEDAGTNSDWAYKSVPFYLSSKGYGVLVNSPGRVEFEIGTENVAQVQFSVPGDVLDYYLIHGPTPREVLEKLTRLTGRPAVPPPWSLGLWLSTSFTTDYNEKTVTEFVDGMKQRDIPLKVFHFDCFWMKERQWCNFEWDRDAFPDPEAMLKRLKARGLKICVWINSYISGLSPLFDEGAEHGYFVKRPDGSVFQRDQWQPSMAIVDFTNPDAVKWYQAKLRKLLEMGVDSFKTDFGERIPDEGVVYHDGSDPKLMHNYYPYLYNKAVFDLLEDFHGKGNALVFARSATAGCQKFPVHWGGDCDATFSSMAESLRAGLSFCLSGAAFWSHDIGGFNGTANPAVYKRWTQFGLLSSHSRLHGSTSYRVPWIFDEQAVEVMRHFAKLKNRLFPYLYAAALDANEHGIPMMRAMLLEFPKDPACYTLDRQYMLGTSLLVAPVLRQDDIVDYYLPSGTWSHLLSSALTEGGKWHTERHDFFSLPLMVRPGTLLPMQDRGDEPAWSFDDPLHLTLYHLAPGASASCSPATTTGKRCHFTARREGSRVYLESTGQARKVRLSTVGMGTITDATGGGTLKSGIIEWSNPDKPLTLNLRSQPS